MTFNQQYLITLLFILFTDAALGMSDLPNEHSNAVLAETFHHHIHNFYFNESDKAKPNYYVMHQHASAMSYDSVTHYLKQKLPDKFDHLNRILLHNVYYIPLTVDFKRHQVKYTASYQTDNNFSALHSGRVVWNAYAIDNRDVDIIKGYSCAKSGMYKNYSVDTDFSDASHWFRIDKDYKRIIVNWQSKYVVNQLVKYTIQTLKTNKYDYLFVDDLARNPGNCVNKNFGGQGSYSSWKAGQLDFLQKINRAAHQLRGYHQKPIKTFVNVGSPYADTETGKWYANNTLRFDHYYFESGGFARADILHGQKANSVDPETGLPAFKSLGGGYIPANLTSLGTHIDTMYQLAKQPNNKSLSEKYRQQHYQAAGLAASQGSWFGWYGETSVDKLNTNKQLIHTNEMQLLRVIPNWDNLALVPLSLRSFNEADAHYTSKNSYFDANLIYSVNPFNGEWYVIFKAMGTKISLDKKQLISAILVDQYFNKTTHRIEGCLHQENGSIQLKCKEYLNQGIRLVVQ